MYELPPADVVGYETTCLNCGQDVVMTIAKSALEHRPWRLTSDCPECYQQTATRVTPAVAERLRYQFQRAGGMRLSNRELRMFLRELPEVERRIEQEL